MSGARREEYISRVTLCITKNILRRAISENNKSDHTPGVQNLTPGKRTEGVTSKKLRKVARI